MVWWIDSDRYCVCSSKYFYYETSVDILNDRIFQTTNIMYTLNNRNYDAYDIHCLKKSGVNIFNVDRTIHSKTFFETIRDVVVASESLPEMYPCKYNRLIGLALTMTVSEPIDIDKRVDVVIVKDVKNLTELLNFKRKIKANLPIMLWMKSGIQENLSSMIQFSDGVFVDINNISTVDDIDLEIVYLCKQAYKPVFCVVTEGIEDYKISRAEDFHFLTTANQVIAHQFDGIMLFGREHDHNNEITSVQSVVRAMEVAEKNVVTDVYKLSFEIKTPTLPWISTSLAASLAAKQCDASAIIVLTTSGMSARWMAKVSPPCHIVAITTREQITRRLHLYRKVIPILYKQTCAANWNQERWNRIEFGSNMALQIRLCDPGSKVVILTPFDEDTQYCNTLQILSLPLICEDLTLNSK